jgi:hypothetical protein
MVKVNPNPRDQEVLVVKRSDPLQLQFFVFCEQKI